MTIQEATQRSTRQLTTLYEEGEAAAISDWIMEHLTRIKRAVRISRQQTALSAEQETRLGLYMQRLLTHEPVQYVLNEAWFCGLKFYVDKQVLIPRPETEELVEWIITGCKFPIDQLAILDIGSGSGCIPVALKRRLGKAAVWSVDISREALHIAEENARNLGAVVHFRELDFLNSEQRGLLPSFDVIVSNPPYIPGKDRPGMPRNVTDYEPALALFVPDNDPLVFYRAIADFGKKHLNAGGTIYAEIHESLGKAVTELFDANGYQTELKKDMQGKDRMLRAGRNS